MSHNLTKNFTNTDKYSREANETFGIITKASHGS